MKQLLASPQQELDNTQHKVRQHERHNALMKSRKAQKVTDDGGKVAAFHGSCGSGAEDGKGGALKPAQLSGPISP